MHVPVSARACSGERVSVANVVLIGCFHQKATLTKAANESHADKSIKESLFKNSTKEGKGRKREECAAEDLDERSVGHMVKRTDGRTDR